MIADPTNENQTVGLFFEIEARDAKAAYTCAAVSPSGSVFVTGSRSFDICLWHPAVSSKKPFLTLDGHHSIVECFSSAKDDSKLTAGSASGPIKTWDIVKNQFLYAFIGHKSNVTCIASNPVDVHHFVSGSADKTAKVWDTREPKKCVATLKGNKRISAVDFSPDGRWVTTGDDDCLIKIWDLHAGKLLADLAGHSGSVTSCRFHPNEYLLASGSWDKTVRFWDLETFESVGQSDVHSQPIQQIIFHPSGRCLLAASNSGVSVLGWEPFRLFDSCPVHSSSINDLPTVTSAALAGGQVYLSTLSQNGCKADIRCIDETTLKPFSNCNGFCSSDESTSTMSDQSGGEIIADLSPASSNVDRGVGNLLSEARPALTKSRRSFYENQLQSNIDPTVPPGDKDTYTTASTNNRVTTRSGSAERKDINNVNKVTTLPRPSVQELHFNINYPDPFRPRHTVKRSPIRNGGSNKSSPCDPVKPFEIAPSVSNVNVIEKFSKPLQSTSSFAFRRAANVLEKAKATVKPLRSQKDSSNNKPFPQTMVSFDDQKTKLPSMFDSNDFLQSTEIPTDVQLIVQQFSSDLNVNAFSASSSSSVFSEDDCLNYLLDKQASNLLAILQSRAKCSNVLATVFKSGGVIGALQTALNMTNTAVFVDLLNVMNSRNSLWSLDACALVLPRLLELLQSKCTAYSQTGVDTLRLILMDFRKLIREGLKQVPAAGAHRSQEERYAKCQKCYLELLSLRNYLSTINPLSLACEKSSAFTFNPHYHREISLLIENVLDVQ